ncbi:MAG: type II secretion system major pseudopilin GspG [Candidatus Omnitrophota bacterium]
MKKSFTLIELMLVVIIIGVLASLVVPHLAGRAERARRVAAGADIEANIPSGLDLYEMDMGAYPQTIEELVENSSGDTNWQGPYLKKIPKDPWGKEYSYKYPGEHNTSYYDLASLGRDGILGSEDDIKNWE